MEKPIIKQPIEFANYYSLRNLLANKILQNNLPKPFAHEIVNLLQYTENQLSTHLEKYNYLVHSLFNLFQQQRFTHLCSTDFTNTLSQQDIFIGVTNSAHMFLYKANTHRFCLMSTNSSSASYSQLISLDNHENYPCFQFGFLNSQELLRNHAKIIADYDDVPEPDTIGAWLAHMHYRFRAQILEFIKKWITKYPHLIDPEDTKKIQQQLFDGLTQNASNIRFFKSNHSKADFSQSIQALIVELTADKTPSILLIEMLEWANWLLNYEWPVQENGIDTAQYQIKETDSLSSQELSESCSEDSDTSSNPPADADVEYTKSANDDFQTDKIDNPSHVDKSFRRENRDKHDEESYDSSSSYKLLWQLNWQPKKPNSKQNSQHKFWQNNASKMPQIKKFRPSTFNGIHQLPSIFSRKKAISRMQSFRPVRSFQFRI